MVRNALFGREGFSTDDGENVVQSSLLRTPILLIEDDQDDALLIQHGLRENTSRRYQIIHKSRISDGMLFLQKNPVDLIILDLNLPDCQGLQTIIHMHSFSPELPIVVLTNTEDESLGVQAIQHGAQDYLVKGKSDLEILRRSIGYALERNRLERSIFQLAHYDPLTNLPNRSRFVDRAEQVIDLAKRYDRKLGLLFIDLDHFKTVNDGLGHKAGDLLLQAVARRFKECLRGSDLLCRLGGDEFVALLAEIQRPEDAGNVAQKICFAMQRPFYIDKQQVFANCSIGISIFPEDGINSELLLRHADTAMYKAKEEGRGRVEFFSPTLNAHAMEHFVMANALRQAANHEELILHYQPIVDLGVGKTFGMEALLRWQHPRLGLLSPDNFLPVAEEVGLMGRIGNWTLEAVCRQMQAWITKGSIISEVSVNLSAKQLKAKNLPRLILHLLEHFQLPASALRLEITETALMNEDWTESVLYEARNNGIKIAIDDFGTGYSSLNQLSHLPVDILKIDKSFVENIGASQKNDSIIRAIISMAHNLDLRVVAEGVEKEEQLDFLVRHGCDLAQGFYFGKPAADW